MDFSAQRTASSHVLQEALKESSEQYMSVKKTRRIMKTASRRYKAAADVSKEKNQDKVMNILMKRNVPAFLMDLLKKKRILNLSSINKLTLPKQMLENQVDTSEYLMKQEAELIEFIQVNKKEKQSKNTTYKTPKPRNKKTILSTNNFQYTSRIVQSELSREINGENKSISPMINEFGLEDDEMNADLFGFRKYDRDLNIDMFSKLL